MNKVNKASNARHSSSGRKMEASVDAVVRQQQTMALSGWGEGGEKFLGVVDKQQMKRSLIIKKSGLIKREEGHYYQLWLWP